VRRFIKIALINDFHNNSTRPSIKEKGQPSNPSKNNVTCFFIYNQNLYCISLKTTLGKSKKTYKTLFAQK
jgi:hypothetical protein